MNSLTNDTKIISLVTTAIDTVKIYRSTTAEFEDGGTPGTIPLAGQKTTFHEAICLPTHPALIRDVQWAPFNVRGFDLFATACRDGAIRIYRLDTAASAGEMTIIDESPSTLSEQPDSQPTPQIASTPLPPRSGPQSSLTSAIAGRSSAIAPSSTSTSSPRHPASHSHSHSHSRSRPALTSPFSHTVTLESELLNAHRDVWALCWDPSGQVLMSSGSDGVTKLWKRAVMGKGWLLFADQEMGLEESDEGEEGAEGDP